MSSSHGTLRALSRGLLLFGALSCAAESERPADAQSSEPGTIQTSLESRSGEQHGDALAATLRDANGEFVGRARFSSTEQGTVVTVFARLPEALAGFHGFHLHANDDSDNGDGCIADPEEPASTHFLSADGHFNPEGVPHGEHAGDMPIVLFTEAGRANLRFVTDRFDLDEIVGRAVMLHEKPDNYANVPTGSAPDEYTPNSPEASELTEEGGNAGNRLACGVIAPEPT